MNELSGFSFFITDSHQLSEHFYNLFLDSFPRVAWIAGIIESIRSQLIKIFISDPIILRIDTDITRKLLDRYLLYRCLFHACS